MNKLKISQIQFQAKATPDLNAKLLKKYFEKTLKFNGRYCKFSIPPFCASELSPDSAKVLKNGSQSLPKRLLELQKGSPGSPRESQRAQRVRQNSPQQGILRRCVCVCY